MDDIDGTEALNAACQGIKEKADCMCRSSRMYLRFEVLPYSFRTTQETRSVSVIDQSTESSRTVEQQETCTNSISRYRT
jgi:hypothetical protein